MNSTTYKGVVYWGVSALALVALAGPLPDVATLLAIILIAGVLFTHADTYLNLLQQNTPTGVQKG